MSEAQSAPLNLEYLKKLAKKRLKSLRAKNAKAKLAEAQLLVARDTGFASWRKLKVHIDSQPVRASSGDIRDLFQAIVNGDVEQLRSLLKSRPDWVNSTGPHPHWGGKPQPLHVAIESGHRAIFSALLAAGADINGQNESYDRWSPLMLAIHWKRREMRDDLLRRKARVGLIEALMLEDDEAVQRILRRDRAAALTQPLPNAATALHFARTPAAVEMLLDAGVDVQAKDSHGQTALQSIAARGPSAKSLLRSLKARSAISIPPAALAAVGDIALLRHIVLKNSSIARDPAVLHAAVEQGLFFVVRWLLDRGADVNARTPAGSKGTALHAAAWSGHIRVARLLVERGADVHAIDAEHRTTPAVWARTALKLFKRQTCKSVAEYLEAVQKSREPGASTPAPKLRSSNWKPIMDAAFLGNAKRVKSLLDAGADPNIMSTTVHRYRPLHRAIEHKKTTPKTPGHEEVVRVLLAAGADPKLPATFGRINALQLAASAEPRFVSLLIDRFKPLDIFNACLCLDDRRVVELLHNNPDLSKSKDANNWTPLHHCCASAMYQLEPKYLAAQLRIVRALLNAGANPMATYPYDNWPIPVLYHCCGQHDNPAVAELLFQAGATPYDSETVYHAADEGHSQCLTLIERYADPKLLAGECTKCLCTQAHWGRFRGAKWLLEHGADPNCLGRWDDSALHSAVKHRANDAIVRLLLKHGAEPKLKNKNGRNAIQLATEMTIQRMIPLLVARRQ
jgi:ankyrin repeat protein